MIALLCFVLNVLVSPFKSTSRLEAENAALRYRVVMLRRIVHRRVRLTNSDRIFFIQLYRWFPSVLKVIAVIRPETLVRWHRAGSSAQPRAGHCPPPRARSTDEQIRCRIRPAWFLRTTQLHPLDLDSLSFIIVVTDARCSRSFGCPISSVSRLVNGVLNTRRSAS